MGVGICESAQAKGYMQKIKNTLSMYGPEILVKDIFDGKVVFSTGEPARDLGLPKMRYYAQSGKLKI